MRQLPGFSSSTSTNQFDSSSAFIVDVCLQENGLVPIVEPEVTLGPGEFSPCLQHPFDYTSVPACYCGFLLAGRRRGRSRQDRRV